jgi:hypothetical protein
MVVHGGADFERGEGATCPVTHRVVSTNMAEQHVSQLVAARLNLKSIQEHSA